MVLLRRPQVQTSVEKECNSLDLFMSILQAIALTVLLPVPSSDGVLLSSLKSPDALFGVPQCLGKLAGPLASGLGLLRGTGTSTCRDCSSSETATGVTGVPLCRDCSSSETGTRWAVTVCCCESTETCCAIATLLLVTWFWSE